MRRSGGFTLIELLVAIALLGLVSATVLLSAPAQDGLGDDIERLQARLLRARELAVIDNRPVRLLLDAQGFRFEQRHQQQWLPLAALPPRPWQQATTLPGSDNLTQWVEIDTTGWIAHRSWQLQRGQQRLQLQVDGQGQIDVRTY